METQLLHQTDSAVRRQVMLAGVVGVLFIEYLLRNVLVPLVPTETTIRVAIGVEWALLVVLLLLWVPRVERSTCTTVGIGRWRSRDLYLGAGWFFVATIVSALVGVLLGAVGLESLADLQPQLAKYSWLTLLALAVTGPVVEEILYRGYLIERVTKLTRRVWVAAGVSWLTFTGVHLGFFGLGATLNATVLSAALVWLYVRERSIWPVLVLHALNSVFAYLLVPLLL
ncbi:MAG: CPBP family intramembrane metalloprotease [Anaerolineales bacterium]|nr:CPBP family intramembrane metalloprotease [Anaerolineales bacterium]